jgi:hypothetical protein
LGHHRQEIITYKGKESGMHARIIAVALALLTAMLVLQMGISKVRSFILPPADDQRLLQEASK